MLHAIAYILFILPFTAWLAHELKRKYHPLAQWQWLVGAFLTGILGAALSNLYVGMTGNFVLHASGGLASTLLFIYVIRSLKLTFNLSITTMLLFGFVCALGVLNELLEYAAELSTGILFSFDTHDTWRDFVANTTGASLLWMAYSAYHLFFQKRS